ncbi:MAG: DUF1926 domain-containing protein [Verrucomicrobia bacterium]|nr:DUF1926 domain-containing protein [Verrucomicrobiota bacterium]
MREAIWRELLLAEAELRSGQSEVELLREDVDADGQTEVLAGHPRLTFMVSPHQGGACLEMGLPEYGKNLADVLTRRDEETHGVAATPVDWYERHLFQDHLFARGTTVEQLAGGHCPELGDFILQPFQLRAMRQTGNRVKVYTVWARDNRAFCRRLMLWMRWRAWWRSPIKSPTPGPCPWRRFLPAN